MPTTLKEVGQESKAAQESSTRHFTFNIYNKECSTETNPAKTHLEHTFPPVTRTELSHPI
jgi:hypothetical protein